MSQFSPNHLRRWIDPRFVINEAELYKVHPLFTWSPIVPRAAKREAISIPRTYRAKTAEDDAMLRGLGIKP